MANLSDQPLLGEVELLVLLAVLRLKDEAYAVPIRELIQREADVDLSRGSQIRWRSAAGKRSGISV
jgi:hypothetical protein